MKRLYLVRHAKAINRNRPVPDFERELRKRGRKDARRIARRLSKLEPAPDVILTSPARRAIETARLFAAAWNYPVADIVTQAAIYDEADASCGALLRIVRALDPASHAVMLVGHDPLFSSFAHFLSQAFTDRLPTCGVVCFALDVATWSAVTRNRGAVRFFYTPQDDAP